MLTVLCVLIICRSRDRLCVFSPSDIRQIQPSRVQRMQIFPITREHRLIWLRTYVVPGNKRKTVTVNSTAEQLEYECTHIRDFDAHVKATGGGWGTKGERKVRGNAKSGISCRLEPTSISFHPTMCDVSYDIRYDIWYFCERIFFFFRFCNNMHVPIISLFYLYTMS